jgi:[acyl-carrier-protein] S-malonyltransferase
MALDLLDAGGAEIKELFTLASEIMGRDMRALLEAEGETMKRTDLAQGTVTLANLAAAALLNSRGIKPACCAGHSLGEYAALACAGVLKTEDCFTLVRERGRAMQEATERLGRSAGGMAAVLGLEPRQVEALIAEWAAASLQGLYAANFNAPRQVVVSGTAEALEEAAKRFKAAGAKRVLPLSVAGPFHSPLMAEAAEAFQAALERAEFKDPVLPCYSNVTGKRISSGAEARELALRQITGPVRWIGEEEAIAASGIDGALETGPGRVLQGLWRDRFAGESAGGIPCLGAGTAEAIKALTEEKDETGK